VWPAGLANRFDCGRLPFGGSFGRLVKRVKAAGGFPKLDRMVTGPPRQQRQTVPDGRFQRLGLDVFRGFDMPLTSQKIATIDRRPGAQAAAAASLALRAMPKNIRCYNRRLDWEP